MSNSVVKVTDSMLNDSLFLLVGEDGTVTPDRDTVDNYLGSKEGSTNIQLMQINKSDPQGIEVSLDNLTFFADIDEKDYIMSDQPVFLDEASRNLYHFKLDHDYTPLTSPTRLDESTEEVDELAKTLEILDGGGELDLNETPVKSILTPKEVKAPPAPPPPKYATAISGQKGARTTAANSKIIKTITVAKPTTKTGSQKTKQEVSESEGPEEENVEEEEESDDQDFDSEDDDNDSDYELEEKPKTLKRSKRVITRSADTNKATRPKPKVVATPEPKKLEPVIVDAPKLERPIAEPTTTEIKKIEVKPIKKEKKIPKPPIPDDFCLFSTPDIIKRVGGKEPLTPKTLDATTSGDQPAKISQDNRSKSESSRALSPNKANRLSLDGKSSDKIKILSSVVIKPPASPKVKERRESLTGSEKPKRISTDEKLKPESNKTGVTNILRQADDLTLVLNVPPLNDNTGEVSSTDQSIDHSSMALDASGLEIDQTLLDNINSDEISEDILYQVAQSLVGNPDIQNAIDKGLNEGNLVFDPSVQDALSNTSMEMEGNVNDIVVGSILPQKGLQIVRPDGRVVVIPPIERPATRSRNKRKTSESRPSIKPVKPLDNEHVSGNELDSSGAEEENEDDPNKLWCVCNQPHNNRFMICCDTCEEWYHGKCVNITKAMGQQMESEGKEWICTFCRDPNKKRPQAAARRIRKASRNSRTSTESVSSSKTKSMEASPSTTKSGASTPAGSTSISCVACQKPARKNSIFCSEACILAHAQGVERVVVFERTTGNMLTGNKAPSAANLDQWLKQHPGYEVVRSGRKIVTAKASNQPQNLTQAKLQLVKNKENDGVSLALQRKGIKVGVLKHLPKGSPGEKHTGKQIQFKIISKQVAPGQTKTKTKLIQPPMSRNLLLDTPTTTKVKTIIGPKITPVKQTTPNKPTTPKDKPIPVKTPKSRQAETTIIPQPKQENIRENVQKTLHEQLTNRLKLDGNLVLSKDDVKGISTEIESQLYKCFGDTGQKYRNKYRSLIFNIKDVKNQTLWRRICEKSVNPYQLVRLSPDDLASQELALWRERETKHQLDMIKKSELELLNCNRTYVLKTHKGEEVVEVSKDKIDNTDVITSLTSDEIPKTDSSKDKKGLSKHSHRDKDRKTSSSRSHHSRDRDRNKRRSTSRDRSSSHKEKKRSRSRDKHRKSSSHKSSRHKKESHISTTDKLDKKSKEILEQLVDSKIVPPLEDRIWKHIPQEDVVPAPPIESDSDHEPSSTVTIPTPPRSSDLEDYQGSQSSTETKSKSSSEKDKESDAGERSMSPPPKLIPEEIWKGTINMVDVAQISISAHPVSGDCTYIGKELPSNLDIVGRISPDTVWDYIGKIKGSNNKIISLVRLTATNVEEKMPYLALYSYLSSRNRLGVVKTSNKSVKDFYILPLGSQKPIPQALLPLSGPGFEEFRPALLLGIIVRDKRKRPLLDVAPLPGSTAAPSKKSKKNKSSPQPTTPPTPEEGTLNRSYTPPPVKDPRIKLPLPSTSEKEDKDEDEPYSPGDSTSSPEAADNSLPKDTDVPGVQYDNIPGLDPPPALPSNALELQRQMEELNKKIAMQKSEITSISKNIVSASTEIGTNALASIALPSNLQQILDSIKTIGTDGPEDAPTKQDGNLTIPLLLPNKFSRPLAPGSSSDKNPLHTPSKTKSKELTSVLNSLSEDDLIRKAEEMLGENISKNKRESPILIDDDEEEANNSKKIKLDILPGLGDE